MSFADHSWGKRHLSTLRTFFEIDVAVPILLQVEDCGEHDSYEVQFQDGFYQTYE